MREQLRVIQYGLGPIGAAAARLIVERPDLELVGGVDIDPAKIGIDVGTVIGLERPLGIAVVERLSQVAAHADIVLHTTSSYLDLFKTQLIDILEAGLDVVSTAEELSFPWLAHPLDAAEIDAIALRTGKTALGTGVNPGFIMDALPLFLTGICQRVDRIAITRVINASLRRGPFQAKIGAGMTVEDFNSKMAAGRMGHVGLPESMGMVFDTLDQKLVSYEAAVEPVVAEEPVKTAYFEVLPGQVRGLKQVAHGCNESGEFMTLTFIAALDEPGDGDTVTVCGQPNLEVKLQGTNGDIATVAIAVNALRRVVQAPPGLVTMRDIPLVTV